MSIQNLIILKPILLQNLMNDSDCQTMVQNVNVNSGATVEIFTQPGSDQQSGTCWAGCTLDNGATVKFSAGTTNELKLKYLELCMSGNEKRCEETNGPNCGSELRNVE